ncbi:membrane protein insertion efficiency factor YidD [bacterium]|nr:membrane protein insertion efficiency factor YidD [bacterium]
MTFSPRKIAVWLIRLYRAAISPIFPPSCRFYPTCSEYSVGAIQKHGVFWGGLMSFWRVLRCNPFVRGGEDPVPESVEEWKVRWFRGRRHLRPPQG